MLTPSKVICRSNKILFKTLDLTIQKEYRVYDWIEVNYQLYYAVINDKGIKEFFPIEIFEDHYLIPKESIAEVDLEKFNQWVNNLTKL